MSLCHGLGTIERLRSTLLRLEDYWAADFFDVCSASMIPEDTNSFFVTLMNIMLRSMYGEDGYPNQ